MTHPRLAPLLVSALLLGLGLTACGEADDPPPVDAGTDAGDSGTDAGGDGGDPGSDAGSDAGDDDWAFGEPIEAPNETWTYVPFEGARCANGTETGVAVNLTERSSRVLIFLAGGGACWDALTCFGFKDFAGTATHIGDTMDGPPILAEAQAIPTLFNRALAQNPFKDASYVYVPYCTGDVYGGQRVATYTPLGGAGPKEVHHVGARNVKAFLERLVPTFAEADRVWLTGASAGGYGASINWWRAQEAFGDVRVDVVNDSAAIIDFSPARFAAMKTAWNLLMPPDCEACEDHIDALLPYYAERFPGPQRYALLSYLEDGTISAFGDLSATAFRTALLELRAEAGANQKTFFLEGTSHVLLAQPTEPQTASGLKVLTWLNEFASDAPGWDHAGP